jgi:hypothetical protein
MPCYQTWQFIPTTDRLLDPARRSNAYFVISREIIHIALMDLFGIVEVEHLAKSVQPWLPAAVKHRPFGDALLPFLVKSGIFGGRNRDGGTAIHFGEWQPLLQPYFPEWRNNLELPWAQPPEGTYVFKISLGRVWRQIAISADATLDILADAILRSVDFDSDHLYEFSYRDRYGATVRAVHSACDGEPFAEDVEIGSLPLEPGQSMKFLFDFGDCWNFGIKLESIEQDKKGPSKPIVLKKNGASPEQYPGFN